jgi:hypothetical protein
MVEQLSIKCVLSKLHREGRTSMKYLVNSFRGRGLSLQILFKSCGSKAWQNIKQSDSGQETRQIIVSFTRNGVFCTLTFPLLFQSLKPNDLEISLTTLLSTSMFLTNSQIYELHIENLKQSSQEELIHLKAGR